MDKICRHQQNLQYVIEDALQRCENIHVELWKVDRTPDNWLQITKLPVNETLIWTQMGNIHFRMYV